MHQTNSSKSPKFVFSPTFIFCSPICLNNCGVVFLWKYILVFEKWFFSFDRSNMQIFTVNITRVVWPHVTNVLDLDTFPMSKSSIKTKAVLTMTDMTKSTELQAFIRQKDGYKVTVKISLCICVVLSWDELKVRQNLFASDYKIYIWSAYLSPPFIGINHYNL